MYLTVPTSYYLHDLFLICVMLWKEEEEEGGRREGGGGEVLSVQFTLPYVEATRVALRFSDKHLLLYLC